jgi:hypothetical protein
MRGRSLAVRPSATLVVVAILATACSGRTPVGDAEVVWHRPYPGAVYDDCAEFACADSCSIAAGGSLGECRWTDGELRCVCLDRTPAPCAEASCSASCADLGYNAAVCDELGCRCRHVPVHDAGDDDADVADTSID